MNIQLHNHLPETRQTLPLAFNMCSNAISYSMPIKCLARSELGPHRGSQSTASLTCIAKRVLPFCVNVDSCPSSPTCLPSCSDSQYSFWIQSRLPNSRIGSLMACVTLFLFLPNVVTCSTTNRASRYGEKLISLAIWQMLWPCCCVYRGKCRLSKLLPRMR